MDKISIIVPCYNEEVSLPIFYKELKKVTSKMKKVSFEYIFIDDGSSDNTLNVIKRIVAKEKNVHYLSFSRNFGKEAGMYAGFSYATGDYIAVMDADMQDPPKLIKTMYDEIKSNDEYDCIALYTTKHKDYSFVRKFFTNCWYKIVKKIYTFEQVDGARDFRLMKRKVVDAILSMKEYNRYIKGFYGFVGFNTKWIEYESADRIAGDSKYSLFKLFKYAVEGMLAFSTRPLIISAFVGLIFCLIAFLAIIFIVVRTFVWGDPVNGWPSLVCIIMFLSGLQLFFFGIMGLYMSKIYLEVKNRPIYIIRETNFDENKV